MPATTVHQSWPRELGPAGASTWSIRRQPGRGRLHRPGAPRPLGRRPRGRGQDAVPRRRRRAAAATCARSAGSRGPSAGGPRDRHQAAGRRAAGPGRGGARLPRSRPRPSSAFAEEFAGDPDILVPDVVAHTDKVLVTEWVDSHASLARLIAEGSQEERDHYGEPLRPLPLRRARPAPGCCTPTRTPATSGSCPRRTARSAASGSSTTAPSPGCRAGLPRTIGALIRIATYDDYEDVLDGLRDGGLHQAASTIDPDELRDYLGPFVEPAQVRDVRVLPGLDARAVPADQRPPPARLDTRAAAEPAAGVPAHPPGLARRHRGALPARGRAAVPAMLEESLPGFSEA